MNAPRFAAHGHVLVIGDGGRGPSDRMLARIRREPAGPAVVVATSRPLNAGDLAELLREHLPIGCHFVRLVLSQAGRPDVAGTLSGLLNLEVVAPTGVVLLLPGGDLFVTDGVWSSFRPGSPPVDLTPRYPAARWEAALPPAIDGVTAIPAGLWLHADTSRPGPLPSLLLRLPVSSDVPSIVLGGSGEPATPVEAMVTRLQNLPRALRRRVQLLPYGPDSMAVHLVAERLAARTGATVEVAASVLPPESSATTIDRNGGPGWRPSAVVVRYQAAAAPEVVRGAGNGALSWPLDDRWQLDVVRSGFWLRARAGGADAEDGRRVPPNAEFPLICLPSPILADPKVFVDVVDRALRTLSPAAAAEVRLFAMRPPHADKDPAWAEALRRFGPLLTAAPSGELVPLPVTMSAAGQTVHVVVRPPTASEPYQAVAPVAKRPVVLAPKPAVGRLALKPAVGRPPEPRASGLRAASLPSGSRLRPAGSGSTETRAAPASVRELLGKRFATYAEAIGDADLDQIALAAYTAGDPAFAVAPAAVELFRGLAEIRRFRGVVFAHWPVYGAAVEAEEILGAAMYPPSMEPSPPVLVYSSSGRRLPALGGMRPRTVAFLPGTRFEVLEISSDPRWPGAVLLAEQRAGSHAQARESLWRAAESWARSRPEVTVAA